MSRQIRRTRTRARVLIVGVAGAVGFAAMYFFDPEQGAIRREAAFRWIERKAEAVRRRSRVVPDVPAAATSPGPAAAPPPPAAGETEDDLVTRLRHEVAFLTVDGAGVQPDDELATTTAVRKPSPELRAAAYDQGPDPTSGFAHVETLSRPSPTIIAYDEPAAAEPEAATEPPPVVSEQHRGSGLKLVFAAATAAAVGVAAAALGAWVMWPDDEGSPVREVQSGAAQAIELISQPGARSVPVGGSNGAMVLVVAPDGQAVLIVSGLRRAPRGKAYQAWVVDGPRPKSAGLFRGGETRLVIPLGRKVPKGAVVAVTLERAGGVPAPTQKPKYVAKLT